MKKNITIDDIAAEANVSKSTVSRYLNDGYVKEETKQLLKRIIEVNHYQPNTFARLKAKKSKMIGIIAPCLDSTVTSMVLMALDERLKAAGYLTIIMNTNHQIEEEYACIERLNKMNVDGIVLNASAINEQHNHSIEMIDCPLLFLAQKHDQYPYIINEDYQAGKKIGDYALETKHKDILVITVDPSDYAIGVDRLNGIIDGFKTDQRIKYEVKRSDFGNIESYRVIDEVLSERTPDLIICSTTRQLLAAYKCISDHHLRIPEDISVMAFGGYDIIDLLYPLPTTIQFHPKKLGEMAAQTILQLINKQPMDNAQMVPYIFLEGASVRRR